MSTRSTFESPEEERAYLESVRGELERCETKAEVVEVWKRHYRKVGHRKLARLLLGRSIDEILKSKG